MHNLNNIWLSLLLVTVLSSCIIPKNKMANIIGYNKRNTDSCIFIPFKGVENINLGESNFEEVKNTFGVKPVNKKWVPSYEAFSIGRFDRYLAYPESGLRFSAFNSQKRFHRKKVWAIYIDSNCKCRSKEGLGIGSTFFEIKKDFPNAKLFKSINPNKTEVIIRNKATEIMWFECKGLKDSTEFITERIIIAKSFW